MRELVRLLALFLMIVLLPAGLRAQATGTITGQREREVGANVATIQVAEINKGPITKVADVLTGRTVGVNLQGVSGGTGTSQRIRIRGANSLSLSNVFPDGPYFKGGVYGTDVAFPIPFDEVNNTNFDPANCDTKEA